MTNVFIIHGSGGNPDENWIPWLKEQLQRKNYQVFVPKFPGSNDQTLENWNKVFREYEPYFAKDSILIGHSLGAAFLLRILEKEKAGRAILVSGFAEFFPEIKKFKTESFVRPPFDWDQIRKNCSEFIVYHSDNDPYVPFSKGKNIAQNLQVPVTLIKGAGHFNAAAGYIRFEKLLEHF